MNATETAKVFGALGHEGRIAIFRMLASSGPHGLPSGEIARRMGHVQNTTSTNLSVLANAGLITPRREGRLIFYSVAQSRFLAAAAFLAADLEETTVATAALSAARGARPT